MDGLDVEFERADDLPLLEVAEILVALVHHLAVSHLHSFRLMRTEGQGNFDKKFPLLLYLACRRWLARINGGVP